VKRIEIQSGAASTLYGTNAIGGVVNIITEDAKDRIEVSNNIRFSQKGGLNEQANLDIQKGKIGSYTSYGRQQLDSYQLSPYEEKADKKTGETTLVETNKIAVTGFHSDIISERLTFDPNERLSVYSDVSYYNYHTDRPYDVYAYDIHHQTFSVGAGAKYKISKKAFIRADYNTDAYWSKNDYYKQSSSFEAGD
jgi:outer membrane receptor for ferrienterochelin and colicins